MNAADVADAMARERITRAGELEKAMDNVPFELRTRVINLMCELRGYESVEDEESYEPGQLYRTALELASAAAKANTKDRREAELGGS